ncbi:MAG TPA: AAA family ATPase [Acidimicrobiia bacterium]
MLLEREELLGYLADRLVDAASGRGSLVLVAGEAGAGKTSLVRAFVDALDDSPLVLLGACDPLTTPRPLSPVRDFSQQLPGLDLERDPIDVFADILERVRHTIRPVVMVVEDIHWADAATLDFLRYMGRRIGDSKGVLVCTYRDDEVVGTHPARQVLGQLAPLSSTHRLHVPALSIDAVAQLARDTSVDPEELMRLTDGNAFFVTEVLASGGELPATVQEAVLARVSQLGERSRRVVEGVSVAPRSLEIAHALAIADASPDDVDAALSAGVLVGDGHALRFRHELARAAVEDALPPARSLGLHLRMLEILEHDAERDLARIAHHAIRAGRSDLIVEHAPAAGDEAAAKGARYEAVKFYRAALRYPEALGPERTARLHLKLGMELRALDRPGDSEVEVRQAIAGFRRLELVEELANALGQLQASLWNLRRFEEGWAAMNEALQLLESLGVTETLGYTLYRVAHHHMLSRHAAPAFEYVEKARRIGEQLGSRTIAWVSLMMEGTTHIVVGDADRGVELLRRAVAEADRMDNRGFVSAGLGMLGSGGGEARRYEVAIEALQRGIDVALAIDEDYTVAYNRSWLARIAFEQGRWDDAVRYAELVERTTLQREGIAYITAMSALGRVRVRRGDPGAVDLLEEMTALSKSHEVQHGWNAVCGLAEHHWLADRPEAAIGDLEFTYRRALDTDSQWARGEVGFWMWRLGRIQEPPDGAAEPFALQMSGDWEGSAAAWREIGCPYEVATALADGPPEAKLEALDILDRLGARPLGDRIRNELRSQGVDHLPPRPSDRTLANPAGLTDRQLEVLRLIAEGLGNDEIASMLYISKKTVEHHVSAIYTKLGVATRVEAARAAARIGVGNRGVTAPG